MKQENYEKVMKSFLYLFIWYSGFTAITFWWILTVFASTIGGLPLYISFTILCIGLMLAVAPFVLKVYYQRKEKSHSQREKK